MVEDETYQESLYYSTIPDAGICNGCELKDCHKKTPLNRVLAEYHGNCLVKGFVFIQNERPRIINRCKAPHHVRNAAFKVLNDSLIKEIDPIPNLNNQL